jgi:branched-chain amino acid transport system substrate-binding protein
MAAVTLAGVLALVATACSSVGSSGRTSGSGSGNTTGGGSFTISIGQVGDYTGPVPGLNGQGYGLQAWVKATNAQGGIDGHQIVLHTADAQGNPATEVSDVLQMASQDKVLAFAGMGLTTMSGSAPTLAKDGIPVIGGNTSDVAWAVDPGMYVPGAGLLGSYFQGFIAVPPGHQKVGLVYCVESSGCTAVHTLMFNLGLSKANGGDPVYSAQVSLSAPSFTAQCIAAQQAGVQTLAVAMDPTNTIRLASDCAKQGYRPIYAIGTDDATTQLAASGLFQGAVAGLVQAPWFLTSGAVQQQRQAMAKYFPHIPADINTVAGWTSGVALGMAIENALKAHPDSLTSADIRDGLAQIKNETFGGLTPEVSFTADGVQEQSNCAFSIVVNNGKWVQNGTKPACAPQSAVPAIDAAIKKLGS